MITQKKIDEWISRKKIPIYIHYKERENKWNHVQKQEVDFKFYKCDYCSGGIILKNKIEDQSGGEFILPASRLRRGSAKVVVHNACLNQMLNELDKFYEKREKEK